MENIYKIRVRTNPDPNGLYPSERRYSASTVLGLGVVHLALATTALLLASLSVTVYQNKSIQSNAIPTTDQQLFPNVSDFATTTETNNEQPDATKTIQKRAVVEETLPKEFNPCTNLSIAPSLLTIGALAAGLTGLLAWKRWYIDHNIRWFFCMSVISTATSSIALIITTITIVMVNGQVDNAGGGETLAQMMNSKNPDAGTPNRELVLAYNILIAAMLEVMWSILSTKISWTGMRADYPEDIINRCRGKIEVNTIHKGNRKGKIVPPDILNHFPVTGKLAKYFPKKESGNLPKAESNSEYMDRVKKFLSSNPDNASK